MGWVLLLASSHCWLGPDHPDETLLAPVLDQVLPAEQNIMQVLGEQEISLLLFQYTCTRVMVSRGFSSPGRRCLISNLIHTWTGLPASAAARKMIRRLFWFASAGWRVHEIRLPITIRSPVVEPAQLVPHDVLASDHPRAAVRSPAWQR